MFNKFKNRLKSVFQSQPGAAEKTEQPVPDAEDAPSAPKAEPAAKARANTPQPPAPATAPPREPDSGIMVLDSGVIVLEPEPGAAPRAPSPPPSSAPPSMVAAEVAWAVPSLHAPHRAGAQAAAASRPDGRSEEPTWDEILERARARAAANAPSKRPGS